MIKKGNYYFPGKDFKKKAWINDSKAYKISPLKFWEKAGKELLWQKRWTRVFVHKPPYVQWFVNGKMNISENCLDRHLEEHKNEVALIWESEQGNVKTFTYYDLFREVNKLANALKRLGIKKGDKVGIYLPMIPEAAVSMLACARIGAVHVVVFSAFSSLALKTRIKDSKAKLLITADGYYRRGEIIKLKDKADQGAKETKVKKMIVVKRAGNKVKWKKHRDIWYKDLVEKESDFCKPESMDSEDPLFILCESGTSGQYLPILHTTGGYAVQAYITGKLIFDFKETDIFWCTADIGWVTGHTYGIYAPLLNGTTFVMFEGAPDFPKHDRWARIIEKHGVTIFYTAPTAIRMFKQNPVKKHKFKTLRLLGSVGEPMDESVWKWYFKEIGKQRCPIVDTWWQTETGGIMISSLPGVGPFRPGFAGKPFPGIRVDILNDKGEKAEKGNLVILPPFCPGFLRGVYNNKKGYLDYWQVYGNKIYFTSDAAFRDKKGLIRLTGRVDEVIKVAGHRLSTAELENAVSSHEHVLECAVVGAPDKIKRQVPIVFAVSKRNVKKEIINKIQEQIGPIALPKKVYIVKELPKTRSGKIMRKLLRSLFTKEPLKDISALANPESIKEIIKKL